MCNHNPRVWSMQQTCDTPASQVCLQELSEQSPSAEARQGKLCMLDKAFALGTLQPLETPPPSFLEG